MIKLFLKSDRRGSHAKGQRGLAAAVALGAVLFSNLQLSQAQESSALALSDQDALRLGIVVDTVGPVPQGVGVTAPATVIANPNEGSLLFAVIDGSLGSWSVDLGEAVHEGQVIATLQSAEVSALQSEWLEASAALAQAELEAERIGLLFEQGVVAERRLQQSKIALRQAQSNEALLAQSMQRIGFRGEDLQELLRNNSRFGVALLRAPRDGVIVHKAIQSSEPIMMGEALGEIESLARKWVSLSVSARLASDLALGAKIAIENSAATLTLRQRDYSADPRTQSIELFAEFDTDVHYLLGTTLQALVEPVSGGVLVPAAAVVYSEGRSMIYVRENEYFVPRELDLTPLGRDYSASTGLAVGDRIAVRGAALLKGMQLGLGGDS